uniref:Uncharacterized protein n=1 Tax=Candidatus Kentrum eta TaxID=2126337 RepID=A0A450UV92_9GAMM|nr:MAG: hypothetical protein BECKH772A_GA0070896_100073 [Candidatus Kentron sp. H]VFJ90110.1 MAG: hypothetical protein BECKH772B_GA0070898_100083 [Candidatus Kentron sp. H]VFJ96478.1 MAG: hypothetical protein BECKH772C_GA0070978_100073 [Candidatus Kentron sp. H]
MGFGHHGEMVSRYYMDRYRIGNPTPTPGGIGGGGRFIREKIMTRPEFTGPQDGDGNRDFLRRIFFRRLKVGLENR